MAPNRAVRVAGRHPVHRAVPVLVDVRHVAQTAGRHLRRHHPLSAPPDARQLQPAVQHLSLRVVPREQHHHRRLLRDDQPRARHAGGVLADPVQPAVRAEQLGAGGGAGRSHDPGHPACDPALHHARAVGPPEHSPGPDPDLHRPQHELRDLDDAELPGGDPARYRGGGDGRRGLPPLGAVAGRPAAGCPRSRGDGDLHRDRHLQRLPDRALPDVPRRRADRAGGRLDADREGPGRVRADGGGRGDRRAADPAVRAARAAPLRARADAGRRQVSRRLTMAQALVAFLAVQQVERDGVRAPLFAGCLGIFGHGNVAGLGQALQQDGRLRFVLPRNEQAMVHTAAAYAKQRRRLQTWACTSSIGPGATNMVTGAALATVNRLPVLLLPGDVFASRRPNPVLQQLEAPGFPDASVNDAFRPVSRFFDRINRPDQLPESALEAMRVLTDPAETGAVTLALPQDVQTEAFDYPDELFADRVWRIARRPPAESELDRAADLIRGAERPLIVAGGGVRYADAVGSLRSFVERTGIPVAETQAGKGALDFDDPASLGALGATGTLAANRFAASADDALAARLDGFAVPPHYADAVRRANHEWDAEVERLTAAEDGPLTQAQVIGAVNAGRPNDVVVCAAGSLPGDLHKLWRARDPDGYHLEYGYSCMGYEVAGGLGVKLADPEREVIVMVGDGSWLMMSSELVTSIQEGARLTVVLIDNHGFGSIGGLSRSVGSDGFGTSYPVDVDFAANAASLGAVAIRAESAAELRDALEQARNADRTVVIVVECDPTRSVGAYESWWEVPVAEVSDMPAVARARDAYEVARSSQRPLVGGES